MTKGGLKQEKGQEFVLPYYQGSSSKRDWGWPGSLTNFQRHLWSAATLCTLLFKNIQFVHFGVMKHEIY